MKKAEKKNFGCRAFCSLRRKAVRNRLFFRLFAALFLAFLLPSCEEAGKFAEAGAGQIGGGARQAVSDDAYAGMPRAAVLIRGNYREIGVAGFGENGFASLTGEYRFRGIEKDRSSNGTFSVYVTAEPLYFSDEWKERPSTENLRVLYRAEGEESFAAFTLDGGGGTSWTVVFHFPRGVEETGLDSGTLETFLRSWVDDFLYFLSLAKSPSELSLPAVAEF